MDGGIIRCVHHRARIGGIEGHLPSGRDLQRVTEVAESAFESRIPHYSSDEGGSFLAGVRGHETQPFIVDAEIPACSVVAKNGVLCGYGA